METRHFARLGGVHHANTRATIGAYFDTEVYDPQRGASTEDAPYRNRAGAVPYYSPSVVYRMAETFD